MAVTIRKMLVDEYEDGDDDESAPRSKKSLVHT
jgi:hypothetical protein